MSKIQVYLPSYGMMTYLDEKKFIVLEGMYNIDYNMPAIIGHNFTNFNVGEFNCYTGNSLIKYGPTKSKHFIASTRPKIPTLLKIDKLGLNTRKNPIYFSGFLHYNNLNHLINNYNKIPNKLVIKNNLGARSVNVTFITKDVFIDLMHKLYRYGKINNVPKSLLKDLKPVNIESEENYHNFFYSNELYVEEDFSSDVVAEFRLLYNMAGELLVVRREGYVNNDIEKKSKFIGMSNKDSFGGYDNNNNEDDRYYFARLRGSVKCSGNPRLEDKFLYKFKKLIVAMDAPIISMDVLFFKDGTHTFLEAQSEFGYVNIPPKVIKEFTNNGYIEYAKYNKLIK